jgi:hypothetical protein
MSKAEDQAYWTSTAYNAGAGNMEKIMAAKSNKDLTPEQQRQVRAENQKYADQRTK